MHDKKKPLKHKTSGKLIIDWTNKSKKVLQYKNLNSYFKQGNKVIKLHTVHNLRQSPLSVKHIKNNGEQRAETKIKVEKVNYKLFNNSFFEKLPEFKLKPTNPGLIDKPDTQKI